MAVDTKRSERIALRVTSRQKQTIEAAAAMLGRSLTDFAVQVAVERADEVLADQRVFYVTDEKWDEFQHLIDEPLEPNMGVAELFSKRSVFTSR